MPIDRSEVAKIAHLARLAINEDNISATVKSLSDILGMVAELNNVETSGIEPMAHPLDEVQRLRADEITETDQRAKFQSIAPATEAGLYLVPKVIE